MTCASCTGTIENGIKNLDGIKNIIVRLLTNEATIIFDSSIITSQQICKEIENFGYDVQIKNIKKYLILDNTISNFTLDISKLVSVNSLIVKANFRF